MRWLYATSSAHECDKAENSQNDQNDDENKSPVHGYLLSSSFLPPWCEFHIPRVVVHFWYTKENRINPEWVNPSGRTVMRKLGSTPTQNWERQDAPVKVAGMPGAAYAQTVKQGDWISIHDSEGTQLEVIRGIAMDWLSKTNAVALAGYSIGTNMWHPNGNPGGDYSFYRAEIAGESVLSSKTAGITWGNDGDWTSRSSGSHGDLQVGIAEPRPGHFEITVSQDENVLHSESFSGDLNGAKAHADVIFQDFETYGDWG